MRTIVIAFALALAPLSAAEVKVEKIDYKGWKDSYRITNGIVDVVVVPQIGRVMRYGYLTEGNMLWENEALVGKTFPPTRQTYRNYGGDKLWIAPQSLWNWPPDPAIDGSPWTAEVIPNGLRLTSGVGNPLKVRMRREITVADLGTEVTFQNSIENLGDRLTASVWQVTQLDDPDAATLVPETTQWQPKGWHGYGNESLDGRYHTSTRDGLVLKRNPKQARKFGARSSKGVLTAVRGSTRFLSESRVYARVPYPDNGSAQQVYLAADPDKYVELEHTSPLMRMDRGERITQTVKWRLQKG